ncbi:hypothetical protein VOLCADRAFT_101319, partial [Volvox carteri f. nagariensis]
DGWTALMGAVLNRSTAMAELLLAAGAQHSVLVPPGELLSMESTPLMAACGEGSLELVSLLLEAGTDPNLTNTDWPSMRYHQKGRHDILELLAAAGIVVPPPPPLDARSSRGCRSCSTSGLNLMLSSSSLFAP